MKPKHIFHAIIVVIVILIQYPLIMFSTFKRIHKKNLWKQVSTHRTWGIMLNSMLLRLAIAIIVIRVLSDWTAPVITLTTYLHYSISFSLSNFTIGKSMLRWAFTACSPPTKWNIISNSFLFKKLVFKRRKRYPVQKKHYNTNNNNNHTRKNNSLFWLAKKSRQVCMH